jgi:hypothetical protein
VTFASARPWGQVSRMRAGQDGASQRSPSLLLYITVQESWKGSPSPPITTTHIYESVSFGWQGLGEPASRRPVQLYVNNSDGVKEYESVEIFESCTVRPSPITEYNRDKEISNAPQAFSSIFRPRRGVHNLCKMRDRRAASMPGQASGKMSMPSPRRFGHARVCG